MRYRALAVVAAALVTAAGIAAQQKPQDVALQAAIRTETAAGDLKGAIAQYEQVVAKFGSDRAVVATALVRMAECYRMLGEAQARTIFERVVREFPEQTVAANLARGRLAQGKPAGGSSGMVNRQIWTGPSVDTMGTVSPDGRYVSFTDWSAGDLAIRDLGAQTVRKLTAKAPWAISNDYAESSAISKDGSQIAYGWYNDKTSNYELRLLRTDAAPGSTPRTLLAGSDIGWLAPYDWSPDGKRVAVQVSRSKVTEIGVVDVTAGTFSPLRSTDAQGATRLFFSPDGSQLAYDLREENSAGRDVFILNLTDRRQTAVSPHEGYDLVCGWSPDGRTLLFASDRSGSLGLWAQPVAGGNPTGSPSILKGDLGNLTSSLGLTSAGALLYGVGTGVTTVAFAPVDLEQGRLTGPPRQLETYATTRQPDWSADGQQLATISNDFARRRVRLTVRTGDGSQPRDLPVSLGFFQRPRWAPDGSITVQGQDLKGAQGIYRVDSQTGDTTPLVQSEGDDHVAQPSWIQAGKLLYRRLKPRPAIVIRDLASGADRILVERDRFLQFSASRDGQTVAFIASDPATRVFSLHTIPVAGGAARELFRVAPPERLINLTEWTPDGRSLLFGRNQGSDEKPSLWMISAAGGAPRKVEGLTASMDLRLHPDGRQVAYSTGQSSEEMWTLENFLPSPSVTGKQASRP